MIARDTTRGVHQRGEVQVIVDPQASRSNPRREVHLRDALTATRAASASLVRGTRASGAHLGVGRGVRGNHPYAVAAEDDVVGRQTAQTVISFRRGCKQQCHVPNALEWQANPGRSRDAQIRRGRGKFGQAVLVLRATHGHLSPRVINRCERSVGAEAHVPVASRLPAPHNVSIFHGRAQGEHLASCKCQGVVS